MVMSTSELSVDEIDKVLADKISGLTQEKKMILLEWLENEFPDLHKE